MATRDRIWAATTGATDQAAIDEGLRAYMLRVYNYMGAGLALSGIVAAYVGNKLLKPAGYTLVSTTESL